MLGHFPHFRFYSMDFEFFFLAHINMQYLKCSLHVPLNNTKSFEKMNFTVHNFILDLPIGVLFKYSTFSSKVYSA